MLELNLSKKEWEVLEFFLNKESTKIEQYCSNLKSGKSSEFHSFSSYPEDMIGLGLSNISKPKIGDACKELYSIGILGTKRERAKNNRRTKFYFLKSDLETIKILVGLIIKKSPEEIMEILSHRYFSYHINESLVRRVLAEKNVSIVRVIPLLEWKSDEAQQLLNTCENNSFELSAPKTKFQNFLKECIGKYEIINKKNEDTYFKHLDRLFQKFSEDLKNCSCDSKKYYYSNDYLFRDVYSENKDITELSEVIHKFPFGFRLPVFVDEVSFEERVQAIRQANNHIFSDENSKFRNVSNDFIKNNFSGFHAHYRAFEFEKLVLPLLALIWCSPSALYEFLCGEWKGFNVYFKTKTQCSDGGFIARLLHMALKDILANLIIPSNTIIHSVSSKKFPSCTTSTADGICLLSDNQDYHIYEQLTDGERKYWGSKPYLEIEKLVNSSLRIKLKHLWELFFDVGFSVVSGSRESSNIILNVNMDINSDLMCYLFTVKDIKNPTGLISRLQKKDEVVYSHIFNHFSNTAKNLIQFYDVKDQPSIQFQKMLVKELNYAILDGHLCNEKAFEHLKEKHKKVKEAIEVLSQHQYSKEDILDMVGKTTQFESQIISYNRYIIEKIFEDELDQMHSSIFEEYFMSKG